MRAAIAIASVMIKELIRKKDFYVLFIFMLILLGLLCSQQFFHIEGISNYIKDFGYSLVMLFSFIITVTFSAKQLPSEIASRTIYPLLAKPLSRFKIIFGKFCGSIAVSTIVFISFFAMFFVFYVATGGENSIVLMVQGFVLGILFLCLVAAIVILFSNFMTVSANITVTFLLYFIINNFASLLRDAAVFSKGSLSGIYGFIYYALPHFEFYDLRVRIVHVWDPLPLWVFASIIFYTILYSGILLYLSGYAFTRREL